MQHPHARGGGHAVTWTKTSDDFADDCWSLSDAAYRLHHEGLTWSNRKLLDCRIPKDDLTRFKARGAIDELLRRGFWEEDSGEYVIVHHAGDQRTADQVIRMQDSRRANGAKGGRPKGAAREIWKKPSSEARREATGTGQGQDGPGQEDPPSIPRQREIGWENCPDCGSLAVCDCQA